MWVHAVNVAKFKKKCYKTLKSYKICFNLNLKSQLAYLHEYNHICGSYTKQIIPYLFSCFQPPNIITFVLQALTL
jgi:hypothetical protein